MTLSDKSTTHRSGRRYGRRLKQCLQLTSIYLTVNCLANDVRRLVATNTSVAGSTHRRKSCLRLLDLGDNDVAVDVPWRAFVPILPPSNKTLCIHIKTVYNVCMYVYNLCTGMYA